MAAIFQDINEISDPKIRLEKGKEILQNVIASGDIDTITEVLNFSKHIQQKTHLFLQYSYQITQYYLISYHSY